MSEIVSEYKLENFQKVRAMGTKGNMWLIRDSVTEKNFVMRRLAMDSLRVYQILMTIHHPNISEIIDVFTYKGSLYVIEENIEWVLLSERIKQKLLSRHHVYDVGKQLLKALSVLHEHNIVHRDVKPENIMMDGQGNIKLIDFDIARLISEEKSTDTVAKGSRDYASPEQYGFSQSDCRTDIYSLGVTLNVLATGKLPEEKLCAGSLGAFIRHCTEFDPKRRYQSANSALTHMIWLKKRSAIFFSASGIILGLVIIVEILFSDNVKNGVESLTGIMDGEQAVSATPPSETLTENQPDAEFLTPSPLPDQGKDIKSVSDELFAITDYRERVIRVRNPELYPAAVISEDGKYEFTGELEDDLAVALSVEKKNELLWFSCKLANGDECNYKFEDTCEAEYEKNGSYSLEESFRKCEILISDFDGNGEKDFLVTFARQRRFQVPESEDYSYRTMYCIVWVVYRKGNALVCAEPLYFEDDPPTLELGTMLFDNISNEGLYMENGEWFASF